MLICVCDVVSASERKGVATPSWSGNELGGSETILHSTILTVSNSCFWNDLINFPTTTWRTSAMFHKVSHLVSLSLLLIVQFLSADVSSNIEPFPMSGFPPGASSSGGSGSSETSSAYLANDNINNINNGASGTTTTSTGYPWSPRQVVTKLGVVQGFIVRPPSGYEAVEVFLNLPYASSPEGSLRFMPPVSGSPWNGIRRSESPSPVCPQVLPNIRNETEALKMMPRGRLTYLRRLLPHLRNQSEDCLYLNVYVPGKLNKYIFCYIILCKFTLSFCVTLYWSN